MIKTENGTTVITCDRCGVRSSASTVVSNKIFFSEGWTLRSGVRKYQHLCKDCDFVIEIEEPVGKFILDNLPLGKRFQTANGLYIHYSDVCTLLKKIP